jgi:hypothetical protein
VAPGVSLAVFPSAEARDATSGVLTLFTGLRLSATSELTCDVQETGGHGLGEALGFAGHLNLDVVHQEYLALGGLGFSAWRRPIELWPRKHCGDVLYDAYVARILSLF